MFKFLQSPKVSPGVNNCLIEGHLFPNVFQIGTRIEDWESCGNGGILWAPGARIDHEEAHASAAGRPCSSAPPRLFSAFVPTNKWPAVHTIIFIKVFNLGRIPCWNIGLRMTMSACVAKNFPTGPIWPKMRQHGTRGPKWSMVGSKIKWYFQW